MCIRDSFVSDTNLGTGSTSFTGAGVTIGIGTTAFDNIYEVAEVSISPDNDKVGIVTCRATIDSLGDEVEVDPPYHQLLFKLTASDADSGDQFGYSTGIGTDRIVVGAPSWDASAVFPNAGAVYMFDFSGNQLGIITCLLYTSPSPRDQRGSRMPSSA